MTASIIIASAVFVLIPSRRINAITEYVCSMKYHFRYNEIAEQWMEYGLDDFNTTSFTLVRNTDAIVFEPMNEMEGLSYPFRDKCDEKEDPQCFDTHALYYDLVIPIDYSSPDHMILTQNGTVVLRDTLVFEKSVKQTMGDLKCNSIV